MMEDYKSVHSAEEALAPQTIDSDTDTEGSIIDVAAASAVLFVAYAGTLTDGAYALKLEHGDESDLSDAADCGANEVVGESQSFAATGDNTAKLLSYVGAKRYVRLVVTSTSTSSGGTLGAVAIKRLERA